MYVVFIEDTQKFNGWVSVHTIESMCLVHCSDRIEYGVLELVLFVTRGPGVCATRDLGSKQGKV